MAKNCGSFLQWRPGLATQHCRCSQVFGCRSSLPFNVLRCECAVVVKVEAHENSLASPYTRQMWEVQDYIIETSHLSFPWHWVASAPWWDGLTDEQRTAISEAAEEARQHGTQVENEKDEFYREALIEKGMEFIEVDQAPFREKAAPDEKKD